MQRLPVILFSVNGEIEIIADRIGANGFLKKPFEINSLPDIIKATIPVLI